jgi:hypothetical protein
MSTKKMDGSSIQVSRIERTFKSEKKTWFENMKRCFCIIPHTIENLSRQLDVLVMGHLNM